MNGPAAHGNREFTPGAGRAGGGTLAGAALIGLVALAGGFAAAAELRGPYLGQTPPGTTPQVFAPGFVSTAAHEFSCSFTPDGREFYFTRRDPERNVPVIMVTRCVEGIWSEPALAPFAENQASFEPRVTPDGKRLYYTVLAPPQAGSPPSMSVWYVERSADGWGEPQDAGPTFNPLKAMYISLTAAGTIYTTDVANGPGSEGIAVSRLVEGRYQALERLGPPINTGKQEMYPYVAPDESYLVFASQRSGPETPVGLFVARRQGDGSWSEPRPLDLGIRGGAPVVSPDGKFLFFTGGERGKSDIYWVAASVLEDPAPAPGR